MRHCIIQHYNPIEEIYLASLIQSHTLVDMLYHGHQFSSIPMADSVEFL